MNFWLWLIFDRRSAQYYDDFDFLSICITTSRRQQEKTNDRLVNCDIVKIIGLLSFIFSIVNKVRTGCHLYRSLLTLIFSRSPFASNNPGRSFCINYCWDNPCKLFFPFLAIWWFWSFLNDTTMTFPVIFDLYNGIMNTSICFNYSWDEWM